jgi:bifunctional DNA-binding transcriptional regulator/antitoxin component of YhaV-PrlF toxin-antitoxin module
MFKTTMDAKRRINIPVKIKNFKPGDRFEVQVKSDQIILKKTGTSKSWLDILQTWPEGLEVPPRVKDDPREIDLY